VSVARRGALDPSASEPFVPAFASGFGVADASAAGSAGAGAARRRRAGFGTAGAGSADVLAVSSGGVRASSPP
jgi:hypothetical protein